MVAVTGWAEVDLRCEACGRRRPGVDAPRMARATVALDQASVEVFVPFRARHRQGQGGRTVPGLVDEVLTPSNGVWELPCRSCKVTRRVRDPILVATCIRAGHLGTVYVAAGGSLSLTR